MSREIHRRTVLKGAGAAMLLAGVGGAPARSALSREELWQPPVVTAGPDGTLSTELVARYGEHRLAGMPVSLRGYDGLPVGRTLRLRAGSKLNVTLKNELPFDLPGASCGNQPHSFNVTNLHLHGMHVSPNEPQDYILLTLVPRVTAESDGTGGSIWQYGYRYEIEPDHPCGTFYYHSHYHGSVALQVASGMGGALIVLGAVDDIPEIARATEKVMMFQSPRLDAFGRCESAAVLEQPGPTVINGQLAPRVTLAPGEVQRWRLINGTHMTMLDLSCPDAEMVLLCRDGNPRPRTEVLTAPLRLVPGNRADVLVRAPKTPGTYALFDGEHILATLAVEGTRRDDPLFSGALPSFTALKPLEEKDINYGRRLVFGMAGAPPNALYTVNNRPFSCDLKDAWTVKLNTAEEWEVINQTNDIHPFHIHTNPFQLVEGGNAPPGTWLDTVEIPPAQRVRFRTRFLKYAGAMVFHCHTLPHEDMGMMQIVLRCVMQIVTRDVP